LGSLQRLKQHGLVHVLSAGVRFVKATLTESGVDLIHRSVKLSALRRVTAEFGDNP